MQARRSQSEAKFLSYMFRLILSKGGTRMLMVSADIVKEMQVLDPKDDINLYRKRYGNIDQCLKEIKNAFFIIDSMVIKFKPFEEIQKLKQQGHIEEGDYQYYLQVYKENEAKNIQVLKINNMNECSQCGQQYKININNPGSCTTTGQKHLPKHN